MPLPFLLFDHGEEIVLGKDGDAQFPGLLFLGACVFTHHHISGLFTDGASSLATEELDLLRGLVTGELGQGAGQHEGHSCKAGIRNGALTFHVHARILQPLQKMLRLGRMEPIKDSLYRWRMPGSSASCWRWIFPWGWSGVR